ncbi:hypothetical protein GQ55_6G053800 [Panicum hallii var. hallii]|uniref:Uncharacterized protein n=1 Tax=Panicum hallii var. hallii TaxID=1504633 RepID=A0A2T7D449_9POAL|nr:hypothetical protein GQ55_6G053800 [Panicum hallii var. hallii]
MRILISMIRGAPVLLLHQNSGVCPNSMAESLEAAAAATTNSTSIDESKTHLVFCIRSLCATRGVVALCFCCQKSRVCCKLVAECQARCPACDPKRQLQPPPDSSVMENSSSSVTANNGTLA